MTKNEHFRNLFDFNTDQVSLTGLKASNTSTEKVLLMRAARKWYFCFRGEGFNLKDIYRLRFSVKIGEKLFIVNKLSEL